jgi:hypothetical protein
MSKPKRVITGLWAGGGRRRVKVRVRVRSRRSPAPGVEGLEGRALLSVAGFGGVRSGVAAVVRPFQAQIPTTLTLAGPTSPVNAVQSFVYTAQVGVPSGNTTPPSGTVTFSIDGVAQPPVQVLSTGMAGIVFGPQTAGPHTVLATYSGDFQYGPSGNGSQINISQAPTFTTLTLNPPNRASAGQSVFLSASVGVSGAAPGFPAFTGSMVYFDYNTVIGVLPVTAGGTATLVKSFPAGSHLITAAYTGDANFLNSPSAHIPLSVTGTLVGTGLGGGAGSDVRVASVERFGVHLQPTTLALTFNQPMDEASAENTNNYVIYGPNRQVIHVDAASYDPASQTVALAPHSRLNLFTTYFLVVRGTAPGGLVDVFGDGLDGQGNGTPGTDFVTTVTARNLATPSLPLR